MDGVISHDDNVVRKAIKDFWEGLLSTERPYDKVSLDELIADHKPHFPSIEKHDVDRKKVDKLLQRTNNMSTGPDGIPFSLYKATQEKYFDMWVELIQQAGECMDFPPCFGESQLCLIPKVENIPHPDQFRPISVTNSDYRIVMRYWAKWLMEIASKVISKEQHAMFKGRSIDEAVESVYDSFYKALAEEKDVTFLQTDFCKAYDYVNRDALLHILKGLNAPPQAIYVVEKVLCESETWLPNIGGSKRASTKESIQSQTGVRQGCPISPLLFVIVFDILLVSLKKKHNPQDLSGFMDDLGMVLQRAEIINSLTPTFKKYEEATGAKLNFNKCFVISTEAYKPVGSWSEMARPNYCGDETVYLGVRLSKRLSPLKDWEKVVQKMKKVEAAIKKKGGNFHSRVRMVNTYLTPCMGYLARFKLIPKSVASLMWKSIRSALGTYANTKTSILTSCYPPLDTKPQLCHPIVFNWALLTSHPPMRSDYQSPLSIGAMRNDALIAAQSLSPKVVFGQATHVAYTNMSRMIPIEIKDFYVGEGKAECVVYNLAHAVRPQLKRNLLKFLIRGLPTRDKLAHFSNQGSSCQLCHREKESQSHLLENCFVADSLLQAMGRKYILLKIPGWQETENVCGLVSKYLTRQETSVVSAALLSLWLMVCAEGSQSAQYSTEIFEKILRKNKILPQPPRTQTKKGLKEKKSFKFKGLQVFYDGSGCTDPHLGGAGFAIFREGRELCGGFETIPLGSNNIGEFTGCLRGMQRAKSMTKEIEIVGDCIILTKAAPKTRAIKNYVLNELLCEICELATYFDEIEFTHVPRELNKHADAIATAASWSKEDGECAVNDHHWDPRAHHVAETSEEWIVLNSALWSWINSPLACDWTFPIPSRNLVRKFQGNTVTTPHALFPVQTALENALILPVIITKDIQGWFLQSQENNLMRNFIEEDFQRIFFFFLR